MTKIIGIWWYNGRERLYSEWCVVNTIDIVLLVVIHAVTFEENRTVERRTAITIPMALDGS